MSNGGIKGINWDLSNVSEDFDRLDPNDPQLSQLLIDREEEQAPADPDGMPVLDVQSKARAEEADFEGGAVLGSFQEAFDTRTQTPTMEHDYEPYDFWDVVKDKGTQAFLRAFNPLKVGGPIAPPAPEMGAGLQRGAMVTLFDTGGASLSGLAGIGMTVVDQGDMHRAAGAVEGVGQAWYNWITKPLLEFGAGDEKAHFIHETTMQVMAQGFDALGRAAVAEVEEKHGPILEAMGMWTPEMRGAVYAGTQALTAGALFALGVAGGFRGATPRQYARAGELGRERTLNLLENRITLPRPEKGTPMLTGPRTGPHRFKVLQDRRTDKPITDPRRMLPKPEDVAIALPPDLDGFETAAFKPLGYDDWFSLIHDKGTGYERLSETAKRGRRNIAREHQKATGAKKGGPPPVPKAEGDVTVHGSPASRASYDLYLAKLEEANTRVAMEERYRGAALGDDAASIVTQRRLEILAEEMEPHLFPERAGRGQATKPQVEVRKPLLRPADMAQEAMTARIRNDVRVGREAALDNALGKLSGVLRYLDGPMVKALAAQLEQMKQTTARMGERLEILQRRAAVVGEKGIRYVTNRDQPAARIYTYRRKRGRGKAAIEGNEGSNAGKIILRRSSDDVLPTDKPRAQSAREIGESLSYEERLALLNEMHATREAVRLADGTVLEMSNLARQVAEAGRAEVGVVSPQGRFYTPQEQAGLRTLVMAATEGQGLSVSPDTIPSAASVNASRITPGQGEVLRVPRRPEGDPIPPHRKSQQKKATSKKALKKKVQARRKGQEPYRGEEKWDRETMFEAEEIMRQVARERRKQGEGEVIQKTGGAYGAGEHVVEIAGGKALKHFLRRLDSHLKASGNQATALGKVLMTLEQLPKAYATRAMGHIKSYYNERIALHGWWVMDSSRPGSLSNIIDSVAAKGVTGIRRMLPKHIPGGLTVARWSHTLNERILKDLTSDRAPTTEVGRKLRDYMTRLYKFAEAEGVPTAMFLKNYYPIVLDRMMDPGQRARFKSLLVRHGIAENVADNIILAALDNEGAVVARPLRKGQKTIRRDLHLEEARTVFNRIPMDELRPFLSQDVAHTLIRYSRSVLDRVAHTRRFGAFDEKFESLVARAAEEAHKLGMTMEDWEINRLWEMKDIIVGMHENVNWDSLWDRALVKFQRAGIQTENWAKLGMVVISSLAEPAIGLVNPTFARAYAGSLIWEGVIKGGAAGLSRTIWRARPGETGLGQKTHYQLQAESIGKAVDVQYHDVLTAAHAADIGSRYGNFAYVVNGLHAWTNMIQVSATAAFDKVMTKTLRNEFDIRAGKKKRTEIHDADLRMLEYYGIKVDHGLQWVKDGMHLKHDFYRDVANPAMVQYLNDVVLTPRGGNLPRWMSNSKMAWMSHLFRYPTLFANTLVPDFYHGLKGYTFRDQPMSPMLKSRHAATAAAGITVFYGMSILSEMLRDIIRYGSIEDNPVWKTQDDTEILMHYMIRGLNRTGVLGFLGSKAFDMFESASVRGWSSKTITDSFQGVLASDALILAAMLFQTGAAGGGQLLGKDVKGPHADQVAKFIIGITPMGTALSATEEGALPQATGLPLSKDSFHDWLVDRLRDMGVRKSYRGSPFE